MNYQPLKKQNHQSVRSVAVKMVVTMGFIMAAGFTIHYKAAETKLPAFSLAGLWVSNCYEFEEDVFQVRTFEFVLSHLVTVITKSYSDKLCGGDVMRTSELSATWDIGRNLLSDDGFQVYQLDVLVSVNKKKEFTTVRQIVHVDENKLILGIINSDLLGYPSELDWEVVYILRKQDGGKGI